MDLLQLVVLLRHVLALLICADILFVQYIGSLHESPTHLVKSIDQVNKAVVSLQHLIHL